MIHWIWLFPAVVTGFAVGFILCNEMIAKPMQDAADRYRLMMERYLRSVRLAQETTKRRLDGK